LVELLVVVSVMVLMMSLAIPAFRSMGDSGNFASSAYNIAGTLMQGRAYAMANNTYVLAGIMEVNGLQSSTANPQASGTGRVVIGLAAAEAGTRPYTASTLAAWLASTGTGSSLMAVTKLAIFNNLDLVDLQNGTSTPPTSGNMYRPPVASADNVSNVNSAACASFAWPLGTSSPQYVFSKVIEFNPQGSARMIHSVTDLDSIPSEIEIGIQPAHGTFAHPPPADQAHAEVAAIQIDGITGAVHLYQP